MKKIPAIVLTLALAASLTACGEKSEPEFDQSAPATNGRALAQIPGLKVELDASLAAYDSGNKAQALATLDGAYTQRFSIVRGALEPIDPALTASLERALSARIPDAIRAGADRERVQRLVAQTQTGLDRAAETLRSSG
ncbi:MAG: hypothetical protein EXQ70_04070 [Solirubrobacterales bacterium]|nr:hypothetical protein [Solirubrobacterales bacterium]